MIIYVNVPLPANDNVLPRVRPLTAEDVDIILEDNKFVMAQALDDAAKYEDYRLDHIKGATVVLQHWPELQREIVWRGSWLKRPEVDALSHIDGSLLMACMEVIQSTLGEYLPGSIDGAIFEKLSPISNHLREGKQ